MGCPILGQTCRLMGLSKSAYITHNLVSLAIPFVDLFATSTLTLQVGVKKTSRIGGPHNKGHSNLGSIPGSPYLGTLPYREFSLLRRAHYDCVYRKSSYDLTHGIHAAL